MVNSKTDIVIHKLPHQFFLKKYCSMELLLQYSLFSFCFLEKENVCRHGRQRSEPAIATKDGRNYMPFKCEKIGFIIPSAIVYVYG